MRLAFWVLTIYLTAFAVVYVIIMFILIYLYKMLEEPQ